MAVDSPRIALTPWSEDRLAAAIREGGGTPAEAPDADGIVWTNPSDPQGLADALASSPARWVQLPFAGIETFVSAGVLDRERVWTCAKGAYGPACAEHALTLMLAGARRIHHHVRATSWDDTVFGRSEVRLKDKRVVLFGTGGIGGSLVPLLKPLGAVITGVNRSGRPLEGAQQTVTSDRLTEVVADCDFLVLSAAVTPATTRAINADVLAALPSHAWVVNVGRGMLIDTDALVEALKERSIGGAALDVTDPEPLPDGHPLWSLDNAIVTPHIANTWDMAVPDLSALVRRNVANFGAGRPLEGLVDLDAGY
jgi:D-3-phosphoglycerate dehydrogenase